ncbi:RelA/SpoT family protein [Candidatus Parcubacteria bacterium]|nr:RelA/SpoT family protein [Candidatus Parcubacteria bacterium]
MDVKDIISLMDRPSKEDIALVTKAYHFAEKAHSTQKRYSGEPYFVHLVATAKNLAELQMDATTIAAGLLHDTIEDTGVTPETIEQEFGPEILFLIEGVTKLGKLKYRGAQRHTESLRKLFVAMAQDIRVLIIKLTDRLHNMQTLQHVPQAKQKRIAMETLEVYAPLAYRLGMRKLNRELEDLAFPYIRPNEYKKTDQLLREKSEDTTEHLAKLLNQLKKAFAKEGILAFRSDYRIKGLYSLYRKLVRKDMDIEKVYDISAIRIIVTNVADCYRVLGIVHNLWRPLIGRIKDYIAVPKPNGYQGIHTTVFTGDGSIIEVQIRTEEMHREAEYGIASHLSYKEGRGMAAVGLSWIRKLIPLTPRKVTAADTKAEFRNVPEWITHLAEDVAESQPDAFMEDLREDFFGHRMFVFTPKGDVVDLPVDSTPVDFAYAIHSDIGNHISAAKVNGKMVSIDTPLHNGNTVEIMTKASSHPTEKWVGYCKTALAKRHIRSMLESRGRKI